MSANEGRHLTEGFDTADSGRHLLRGQFSPGSLLIHIHTEGRERNQDYLVLGPQIRNNFRNLGVPETHSRPSFHTEPLRECARLGLSFSEVGRTADSFIPVPEFGQQLRRSWSTSPD